PIAIITSTLNRVTQTIIHVRSNLFFGSKGLFTNGAFIHVKRIPILRSLGISEQRIKRVKAIIFARLLGLGLGFCVGMGRGVGLELVGVEEEEEEPRTLPWPLNLPDDEEEKGLLTFFMNPFILSFMSPIVENQKSTENNNRSEYGTVNR
ncbi:hypothetical protein CR513_51053, partial [Mucuna pruriens]